MWSSPTRWPTSIGSGSPRGWCMPRGLVGGVFPNSRIERKYMDDCIWLEDIWVSPRSWLVTVIPISDKGYNCWVTASPWLAVRQWLRLNFTVSRGEKRQWGYTESKYVNNSTLVSFRQMIVQWGLGFGFYVYVLSMAVFSLLNWLLQKPGHVTQPVVFVSHCFSEMSSPLQILFRVNTPCLSTHLVWAVPVTRSKFVNVFWHMGLQTYKQQFANLRPEKTSVWRRMMCSITLVIMTRKGSSM